jgi:CHAT domain-containing protein
MMSVMIFAEADSTENLLSAIEMYSMKLNSELAVLSACNTGVGQLYRGEGIMSFSRAFAYAGVPSAVISLWKVPDIATSKIMVSFYSYLKDGVSKDKALQLARQDFIKNNPEMAHPYFWAGFILTGNNSPLSFPRSYLWLWIAVSVLVLTGLVFAQRKFRSAPKA